MTVFTVRRPPRKPLIAVVGVLAFAIGTQVAAAWPSAGPGRSRRAAPRGRAPRGARSVAPTTADPRCLARRRPGARPRSHHHPGPGQGRRRRPRRRARPGPRGRRLLGRPPDRPSRRHRRRREARRVRCRRGADDRRRHRLPAGRTGCVGSPGGPALVRAGAGDAGQHPRSRSIGSRRRATSRARSSTARRTTRRRWACWATRRSRPATSATASAAYSRLALVADGSASRVRSARLAFVQGDPAAAVAGDVGGGVRGHRRRARGRRAGLLRRHARRDADRRRRRAGGAVGVRGRARRPPRAAGRARRAREARRVRRRSLGAPSRSSTRPSPRSRCPTGSPGVPTC